MNPMIRSPIPARAMPTVRPRLSTTPEFQKLSQFSRSFWPAPDQSNRMASVPSQSRPVCRVFPSFPPMLAA